VRIRLHDAPRFIKLEARPLGTDILLMATSSGRI
jgi:hypothetical protein